MIDCLLPARLGEIRKKIRELSILLKKDGACSKPGLHPEYRHYDLNGLLEDYGVEFTLNKTSQSNIFYLVWLLEELAASFPEAGVRLAVEKGLIVPVFKDNPMEEDLRSRSPADRRKQSARVPAVNHLFLPPPASLSLRLIRERVKIPHGARAGIRSQYPIFQFLPGDRILIPALTDHQTPAGLTVTYYLLELENHGPDHYGLREGCFPLRPVIFETGQFSCRSAAARPVLAIDLNQFQTRLDDYFLLMTACCSGLVRYGWQDLKGKKTAGQWWPDLDFEIAFLTTEISRLQLALFHLTRNRAFSGGYPSGKVEKLCLKGLHLASRAWRHSSRLIRE